MSAPAQTAYAVRNLPAWRGVRIIVGIFLEGFTNDMTHDEVIEWMAAFTRIERYKWLNEGGDLLIMPRSSYAETFAPDMIEEIERLAGMLERQDRAIFSVYVEVCIPY